MAVKKFHSHVYGRPVNVQTNNNPSVSIVRKELHRASPRFQKTLFKADEASCEQNYLCTMKISVPR